MWMQRDHLAIQPHVLLTDLALIDKRVEAHLDGLRVAEDEAPGSAWELCSTAMQAGEPGEVFPAAVLALEPNNAEWLAETLKFALTTPEAMRSLVSALGWLEYSRADKTIQLLLAAQDPAQRRIGVAALAVHRQNPKGVLAKAIADTDPALKARALRAAAELGAKDLLPAVKGGIKHGDESVRFWAAWSTALLANDRDAVAQLQSVAQSAGPLAERAVHIAARRVEPRSAVAWLRTLAQKPESARIAAIGVGALGLPDLVPLLFEQMKIPALARVAGEAFSMITGVNLAYQDMEGEQPKGFQAGPTEDPADEDVAMDADENRPWPAPEKIKAWWEKQKSQFKPGERNLCGRPMTEESLQHVLRGGFQTQRAAAALELTIRKPGQPLFNVRAPGTRQRQQLGG